MPEDICSIGDTLAISLQNGALISGQYLGLESQFGLEWLRIESEEGLVLIGATQIAAISTSEDLLRNASSKAVISATSSAEKPQPVGTASKRGGRAKKAEHRKWDAETLKGIASALIDGEAVPVIADKFQMKRAQVQAASAGLECARGNLVEAEISKAAQEWALRWQSVFTDE